MLKALDIIWVKPKNVHKYLHYMYTFLGRYLLCRCGGNEGTVEVLCREIRQRLFPKQTKRLFLPKGSDRFVRAF